LSSLYSGERAIDEYDKAQFWVTMGMQDAQEYEELSVTEGSWMIYFVGGW